MPLPHSVYIIASCAFVPILIALGIGIFRLRHASMEERMLIVLVGIALMAELISGALWRSQQNNLFISHIYVPIEVTFLLGYFRGQHDTTWRRFFEFAIIGFVFISVLESVFVHSLFEMNGIARTVECGLLIGVSLLTWRRIMQRLEVKRIIDLPLFWINSAVLIYFSAITLLFVFSRSILSASSELGIWVWSVHLFFMSVYYILISIGLWKIRQKTHLHN